MPPTAASWGRVVRRPSGAGWRAQRPGHRSSCGYRGGSSGWRPSPHGTRRPVPRRKTGAPAQCAWPLRCRRSTGRSGVRVRRAPARPGPGGNSGRRPGGHPQTNLSELPAPGRYRPVAPGRSVDGRSARRTAPGLAACHRNTALATAIGTVFVSMLGLHRRSFSRDRSAIGFAGSSDPPEGRPGRPPRLSPASTLEHDQLETDEASWQCSSDAKSHTRLAGAISTRSNDRKITTSSDDANRKLVFRPDIPPFTTPVWHY